ncbi:MAG: YaeQ family protein [Fibrella sp.]|nr:YaeQ family protein [Armatimonadota bacterium]
MKYTFTLLKEADDATREKIVLESRSSESPRHIVLKILAYLLFRDRIGTLPLRIEPGEIGQRHRPDLLASEPLTEKPLLWIDCGQIEPKRLGRIAASNKDARVVIVKQTAREAELYAGVAKKELPVLGVGAARFVGYLGFDDGFTLSAIALLRGANTICLRPSDDETIALEMNGETLHTTLSTFSGDANSLPTTDFWQATIILAE